MTFSIEIEGEKGSRWLAEVERVRRPLIGLCLSVQLTTLYIHLSCLFTSGYWQYHGSGNYA